MNKRLSALLVPSSLFYYKKEIKCLASEKELEIISWHKENGASIHHIYKELGTDQKI